MHWPFIRPAVRAPLSAVVAGLGVRWSSGLPAVAQSQARKMAPAAITAFVDVAVVPMDSDRVLSHQTVVVDNGRIVALGPTEKVAVPASAVQVDGRGKFLMPGLGDMHTHVSRYHPKSIDRAFLLLLANGVTTIRDMEFMSTRDMVGRNRPVNPNGFTLQQVQIDGPDMLQLREEIRAGKRIGPRMYLSSRWYRDSSKSVEANLEAYKAAGYDHLKIYLEDSLTLSKLVPAAHRLGIPLVGHGIEADFPGTQKLGLKSIEHLVAYPTVMYPVRDSALAPRLPEFIAATVRDSIWNCPCPASSPGRPLAPLERRYVPAEWRIWSGTEPDSFMLGTTAPTDTILDEWHRNYNRVIKMLSDAGAGLLLGSDMPFFMTGFSVHRTLEAFVYAGLTPYQALLTGTRNVAAYAGTLDSAGTVAVGKRADLVLVNGNPLQDIRSAADIGGVMLGGRWLSRADIERRLDRYYGRFMKPLPRFANIYDTRAPELLGGSPGYRRAP